LKRDKVALRRCKLMTIDPLSEADAGVPVDSPVAKDGGSADDRVRERAYLIWVDEGRPNGRDVDHWLRAKWELKHEPVP
jgi:hypothetical protein